MAYNFSNITAATIAAAESKPGHSDVVLFAPLEEFTAVQKPGTWAAPGDKKKITTAHTFPATKGFASLKAKSGTVREEPQAPVGEKGGWVPKHRFIFEIKGHSALIEEWVEELLNAEGIFLFNSPECGTNAYVQLGSECDPATVVDLTSQSGVKNEGGSKKYILAVESSEKYFYSGTVTVKA